MLEIGIMIEGQRGLNWTRWQNIVRLVEDLGFVGSPKWIRDRLPLERALCSKTRVNCKLAKLLTESVVE